MAAHDATLTEALVHLDTTWVGIRDSVLNDRHLLWIGSGISRERFPALPELLERLFNSLHTAQDPANPDCPYFKTAVEIVDDYSHVHGLDLRQPPVAWAPALRAALFEELTNNYGKVLGKNVNTAGVSRNIPFDILTLDATYSDPTVMPDAEHRFIALLMAEGAVTQIVTTNWDPLTERAHKALGVSPDPRVIACVAELDGAGGAAIIFKVHGCAERSMAEPMKYKKHMIATHHQITRWSIDPLFRPFFEKLRTLLRERPSIFVGISGQDFNLQSQCVAVSCDGPAIGFPPPRVTFSGVVGVPQREILQAIHGDNYAPNEAVINSAAALPLYGKPLFGALYVSLLLKKLNIILGAGEAYFDSDEQRALARSGLVTLRDTLCARFDAIAWADRWRLLATELPAVVARLLELYRNQRLPAGAENYTQLDSQNPEAMSANPNLSSLNLHWLALALATLSAGAVGAWRLQASTAADGSDGQLRVVTPAEETCIFLSRQGVSAVQELERTGAIVTGSGRKVLLIYPVGSEPKSLRRHPGMVLPGGHPAIGPREVWFEDCARDYPTASDLVTSLKQEISAAHIL